MYTLTHVTSGPGALFYEIVGYFPTYRLAFDAALRLHRKVDTGYVKYLLEKPDGSLIRLAMGD